MADNRDAIIDAIVARMETIRTANGFQTDAGERVSRWRSTDPGESACPAIDVRDPDRKPKGVYSQNLRDYELAVEIAAFSAGGEDTDGELNRILEDILKAVLEGDLTWGALAINTVFESDRKGLSQMGSKVGVAVARFLIHYRKQ